MTKITFQGEQGEADYLGDGVYAIASHGGVWLHANHHLNPTDRVYLEPEVFKALLRFWERNYEKDDKG